MSKKDSDKFSRFDQVLQAAELSDPWSHAPGQPPVYEPDYNLLGRLLTLPAGEQHYADYKTSSAAPSSRNTTAGHITQPSA
jgi:hypothetical protein